jgi:katanin p60 ATPase-containing subunit A1
MTKYCSLLVIFDEKVLCHIFCCLLTPLLYRQVATDVDIDEVARRTEGYSGDDLTNVCRDASMNGMRRKIAGKTRDEIKNMSKDEISKDPVAMCDFEEALAKVQKSVSPADIEKHEKWQAEFGSA